MRSNSTVAIIGECMLELSQSGSDQAGGPGTMALSYGGDTLNTAVYLARLGVGVEYLTGLGDDTMSDWLLDQWRSEGVGCSAVKRFAGSVPGLYMIQTDEQGERSFLYWRDSAPARRIFDDEATTQQLFETLAGYQWIYLSGITLALYSEVALQRFIRHLAAFREAGGKIAFDGNYRPRLWPDVATARQAFESVARLANMVLPTLEDEMLLFGDVDEGAVLQRLQSWGVAEIALKMGPEGALVVTDAGSELVPSQKVIPVDTTAAGDSFNAAYLAARLAGYPPAQAAQAGHRLAGVVIGHRGAIIAADKMPAQPF